MDKQEKDKFISAVSVLVGTTIGVGFLGMPYIAAQSGFLIVLFYLLLFSVIVYILNLYFTEITLRTTKQYQLTGYAEKYIGKNGKIMMQVAISIAIYSAIIAYLFAVGESISFLFFGSIDNYLIVGTLFGIFMSYMLWGNLEALKKYEKMGVFSILFLFFLTFFSFLPDVKIENLTTVNLELFYLPIGMVLFSLIAFYTISEVREILRGSEHLIKRAVTFGTFIPVIFYALFTFIVVGNFGEKTPQLATFALGSIFILVGIIAMFTSYLALGTSLKRAYLYDFEYNKNKSWFLVTMIPLAMFLVGDLFNLSFIGILSVGGLVSGGAMVLLILIINKRSEKLGDRTPEFILKINNMIIFFISFVFISGIIFNFI